MTPLETAGAGGDPVALAITALGLGAVYAVLAWGGRFGRLIGRNPAIGIRTGGTMSSPSAWRAGHAAAAKWLGIGAVIALMCGVAALLAVASGSPGLAAILGALGLATAVVVMLPAVAAAGKAAREARR